MLGFMLSKMKGGFMYNKKYLLHFQKMVLAASRGSGVVAEGCRGGPIKAPWWLQ